MGDIALEIGSVYIGLVHMRYRSHIGFHLLTPCHCSHDGLFVFFIFSIHSLRPNMDDLRVWLGDSMSTSSDRSGIRDSSGRMALPHSLSEGSPVAPPPRRLVGDALGKYDGTGGLS